MSQIKKVWRCGDCDAEFEREQGALECCAPKPVLRFLGCSCGEEHCSEEDLGACGVNAADCPVCLRHHDGTTIEAVAVRIAGHCPCCNPLFSIDQQFAIEQQFYDLHGLPVALNG
ncbi:hypothetical protein ACLD0W_12775 [Alloalcanivorax sp. C16-1]|uniref:hypothetical protein n=1 Tax=Alloalcanivorax sp. C16-1 TaxID=3390051 RepID=UPI003970539D